MNPIYRYAQNILIVIVVIFFHNLIAEASHSGEEVTFKLFFSGNVAGELEACG